MDVESLPHAPLDYMYTLGNRAQRCHHLELSHWRVARRFTEVKAGATSALKLTLAGLTGKGLPGGKGLIDL